MTGQIYRHFLVAPSQQEQSDLTMVLVYDVGLSIQLVVRPWTVTKIFPIFQILLDFKNFKTKKMFEAILSKSFDPHQTWVSPDVA